MVITAAVAQWECKHDKTSFAWSQQSGPGIPCWRKHDSNFKGIDLTIYEGELVAIVGQSGSGKSTLMNILGCLDRPTSGSYKVNGQETGKLEPDQLAQLRREYFGFIFQRYHLLGDLSKQKVTLRFQLFMLVLLQQTVNSELLPCSRS